MLSAFLAALLLAAPPAAAQGKLQRVSVKPGDTLWSIAQSYLKDPTRWNEILKHNKLPTSDPTVALPGTFLLVPVELIKEELRAARLVHLVRKVLYRKQETADWNQASPAMELYRGDGLRTLAQSWARVQFFDGALLGLDPDSMAILKPPKQEDHDLRLLRGGIHSTHARVVTPSAKVIPKEKGTKYSAKVLEDLSTRVQVYKGRASVEGGGKVVEVQGGFFTDVPLDRAPSRPLRIPNLAELEASMDVLGAAPSGQVAVVARSRGEVDAPSASSADIQAQLDKLTLGVPVAAYHVQVSRSQDFGQVLFEKTYDADAPSGFNFDLAKIGLSKGSYWVRLAVVDLLGSKSQFSAPRQYRVGGAEESGPSISSLLKLRRPESDKVTVRSPRYRILGQAGPSLTVTVDGARTPLDEDGNFGVEVLLKEGPNEFRLSASDAQGRSASRTLTITYEP